MRDKGLCDTRKIYSHDFADMSSIMSARITKIYERWLSFLIDTLHLASTSIYRYFDLRISAPFEGTQPVWNA